MCGRFSLKDNIQEVQDILEELSRDPDAPPVKTGEIFPTDIVPVLEQGREKPRAAAMAWGFPRWDGKGVIFNARAETALHKPLFRTALLRHPVAVPTTGFYEWKTVPGQRKKQKYIFCDPEAEVLYLAGFYDFFKEKSGPERRCFTILTTDANTSMAAYHNRMPLLLRHSEREAWLSGRALETFLGRTPFAVAAAPAVPSPAGGAPLSSA